MKTLNFKVFLTALFLALPSIMFAVDTDSDGLDDSVETNTGVYVSPTNTGTNPNIADSDGDGAGDWYEVATIETNPANPQPNAPNNANIKPNIPYPLPAPNSTPPATNKPVKVYILSGQSNMVGQGEINPLGTPGTLTTITRNENKFPNLLNGTGWSARNDVAYRGVIAAVGKAPLTPGQGSAATTIGPELGFGHVIGYFHDEPVLILKTSEGGRALGWDFLPPGSVPYTVGTTTYNGYGATPSSWTTGTTPVPTTFYGGYQYDQSFLDDADMVAPAWADATAYKKYSTIRRNGVAYISKSDHTSSPASEPGIGAQSATYWNKVFNVTDVLDNFATEYPQYATQGFEIAGFAWFQGWNDGLSYTSFYANRYERNIAQFIRQLRSYYANRYPGKINPNAPFVIATCAFEGWNEAYLNQYPTRRTVINAQLAVGNPALYPEFAGNVKTMEARGFWRDKAVSPSPGGNQGFHYNRSAETFMLVGDALGRGMIDLLRAADTAPPTLTGSAIVDDKNGGPVTVNSLVTYTVTFSEDMDAATVTADDFGNAGTASITIGAVTEPTPGVFTVPVTSTSAGTLRLRLDAAAVLRDLAGNSLVTIVAIPDDTTLTVKHSYSTWADGATSTADANNDGVSNGVAWVLGATNPSINATALLPTFDNTADPNYFIYTYRRSDAANADPNTTIAVKYGSDLSGWTTAVHDGNIIIITPNNDGAGAGIDVVQVKIKRTLAVGGKIFIRLKTTIAP